LLEAGQKCTAELNDNTFSPIPRNANAEISQRKKNPTSGKGKTGKERDLVIFQDILYAYQ